MVSQQVGCEYYVHAVGQRRFDYWSLHDALTIADALGVDRLIVGIDQVLIRVSLLTSAVKVSAVEVATVGQAERVELLLGAWLEGVVAAVAVLARPVVLMEANRGTCPAQWHGAAFSAAGDDLVVLKGQDGVVAQTKGRGTPVCNGEMYTE